MDKQRRNVIPAKAGIHAYRMDPRLRGGDKVGCLAPGGYHIQARDALYRRRAAFLLSRRFRHGQAHQRDI
jgi:hypothetical protein